MNTVPCKGCGKPIVYAQITKADGTSGTVPLDPSAPTYFVHVQGETITAARANGPTVQESPTDPVMVSHFATCPRADLFSGSKRPPGPPNPPRNPDAPRMHG